MPTHLIKLLPILILSLATGLFTVACDEDDKDTEEVVPVVRVIKMGTTGTPIGFDPINAYDDQTWQILLNVGEGLYRFKPGSTAIEASIASAMPQKNSEGTEYTVPLKPGVLFPDGSEVTAESFVYTFTRGRDIDAAMQAAGQPGLNGHFLVSAYVKDVVAMDKYTVKYVLHQPFAFFNALLCHPKYMPTNPNVFPADKVFDSPFQPIEDQAAWSQFRIDQNASMDVTQFMGMGAYRVESVSYDVTLGDYGAYTQMVFAANPQYHGAAPKNDRIELNFYQTGDELEAALLAGTIDIAAPGLAPEKYNEYRENPNYKVHDASGVIVQFLALHHQIAPFDSQPLRQALSLAVDREPLSSDVFQGTAKPLYSMVPMGMWSHKDSFPTHDLTAAMALLDGLTVNVPTEAGDGTTEPFTISTMNKLPIDLWYSAIGGQVGNEAEFAAQLKASFEETGLLEVTLQHSDWPTFIGQLINGEMGMYQINWFPDYVDPDTYLFNFGFSEINPNGYSNPQMDQLLIEAQTTTDDAARTQLYEQIQDIWPIDVPTIPLVQIIQFFVAKPSIQLSPSSTANTFYYSLIERTPEQ